jgi:hypothetical protein
VIGEIGLVVFLAKNNNASEIEQARVKAAGLPGLDTPGDQLDLLDRRLGGGL